jgi:DNA processing protein
VPDSATNTQGLLASMRLEHARYIGAVTYRRLIRVFGSAEAALAAPRDRLLEIPDITPRMADGIAAARNDPWAEQEFERARARGIRLLSLEHPDYPRAMLSTYDPPVVLYVLGELKAEDAISLAIVGSRHSTQYGKAMASKLSAGLATAGFTVVSGLARGIDTAAHLGALSVRGGRTIAVLGNGFGKIYPPENEKLFERIVDGGGAVLTEQPIDMAPQAQHFPGRNRIIAGMTLGTVVVEGAETSGSLITANYAVDMGREVFAVPGSVDSPNSRGPHRLIKRGAKLVEDVEDILDELKEIAEPLVKLRPPDERTRLPKTPRVADLPLLEGVHAVPASVPEAEPARPSGTDLRAVNLSAREKAIYEQLDANTPRGVDAIIGATGFAAQEVLATLLIFEVKRLARQLPGKRYVKA